VHCAFVRAFVRACDYPCAHGYGPTWSHQRTFTAWETRGRSIFRYCERRAVQTERIFQGDTQHGPRRSAVSPTRSVLSPTGDRCVKFSLRAPRLSDAVLFRGDPRTEWAGICCAFQLLCALPFCRTSKSNAPVRTLAPAPFRRRHFAQRRQSLAGQI
jgi:hypothetical protein